MSHGTKDRLLKFLRECRDRDDRTTLANLRCALRNNLKHRAWPILARFGGIDDHMKEYDHHAKVVQTIAGLFATHPKETSDANFGLRCRGLMRDDEKLYDPKDVGPVARRFQHLLSSEREEICDRVIRFVLRMKAEDIPVNYEELFDDLLYWRDKFKAKWAGNFWGALNMEEVVE